MPAYLQPTGPTATAALLPADPGQALLLAQGLLGAPRMSNHSHGLWGYHGETEQGRPLSIQSTGIGGPSAAIVLHELRDLGVERAVRVGACVSLDPGLRLGELLVADRALVADGTSVALGARGSVPADGALTRALVEAAGPKARVATVASRDLYYETTPDPATSHAGLRPALPLAVQARSRSTSLELVSAWDLESAALLALGRRLGVAVASILVFGSPSDEQTMDAGTIASTALAADPAQDSSRPSGVETPA